MATASERTERVISLTLSEKEAQTLTHILSKVGGDPWDSPRRHSDSISKVLHELGFDFDTSVFENPDRVGLMFLNDVDV